MNKDNYTNGIIAIVIILVIMAISFAKAPHNERGDNDADSYGYMERGLGE